MQARGPAELRRARLGNGKLVDLGIRDGTVEYIRPSAGQADDDSAATYQSWAASGFAAVNRAVDLDGMLVVPPLVNGHAHLDKTFLGAAWQPHVPGEGVRARVLAERQVRDRVSSPVLDRSRMLAQAMLASGTGMVRSHVDIDTDLGLTSLHALLELREELKGLLDLQIVAFPQSGILASPGVADLLDAALQEGADLVGGLDPAGFDADAEAHLDVVFSLAERRGAGVDIHLHDVGPIALRQYEMIAARTRRSGLSGQVTVSHAYGLGTLSGEDVQRVGELFATAGVAVMTNGPAGPMPPVLALRDAGVTVFSGSDNIRDAWWPYGSGDMLEVARIVAYQSNFRTDDELAVALTLITDAAAAALGIGGYGITVGTAADLLILSASAPAESIVSPVRSRCLLRRGIPVAATEIATFSPRHNHNPVPRSAAGRAATITSAVTWR